MGVGELHFQSGWPGLLIEHRWELVGLVVLATYLLVWRLTPGWREACHHCQGKMRRIRRRAWHRGLSLVFPLCNMRCDDCQKVALRKLLKPRPATGRHP